MPVSNAVKRLGADWPRICAAVEGYAGRMPEVGVSLSTFSSDCLSLVFPADYLAIVSALKARGLIYPVRNGAAWRIFPRKPEDRRFEPSVEESIDQFVRAISPHMMRLTMIARGYGCDDDRERRLREGEAVRLLSALTRRHVERGLHLGAMRSAVWNTFHPDAVSALVRRERIFSRDSTIEQLAPVKPKRRNLPAGQSTPDRIVGLVDRAGPAGIVKSDLHGALQHPRPKAADFDALIADLEAEGRIKTMIGKVGKLGKPGLRIFPPTARPRVMSDGQFARVDL